MKVLLTNDDGVASDGIHTMSKYLAGRGWLLAVVAPDRERSGVGHAITAGTHVRARPLDDAGSFAPGVAVYSCDGTPTDCVVVGLDLLFPDAGFVVSGINQGANMGDDVTYSGTVCAAMEGVILGRQSVAVSLCCGARDGLRHNMTAAMSAMAVLEYVERTGLPKDTLLNVNVPNEHIKKIKGFKLTKRGWRRYVDKLEHVSGPGGEVRCLIGGRTEDIDEEGSDVTAVRDGYVSITPVCLDMTHYGLLDEMRDKGADAALNGFLRLL
ncbi:MAG: 5'/3'-nucleotidase SurE [Synergistaceae bacterium]|nr:5'/3'-nucleotidase SurE [Synergistaceae bacterium]